MGLAGLQSKKERQNMKKLTEKKFFGDVANTKDSFCICNIRKDVCIEDIFFDEL